MLRRLGSRKQGVSAKRAKGRNFASWKGEIKNEAGPIGKRGNRDRRGKLRSGFGNFRDHPLATPHSADNPLPFEKKKKKIKTRKIASDL